MSRSRSYSIPSEQDNQDIVNGRCPSYALAWPHESNRRHWSAGHDYFLGNGQPVADGTQEIREILSRRLAEGTLTDTLVFCDLDGVLADFEQGVVQRFNKTPDQLSSGLMWGVINKSNTFFETLPWMPKGRDLWYRIRQYNPIILTGVPAGKRASAVEQKRRWCQRELGADVEVITCLTKEKPRYSLPGTLLIDDRADIQTAWQDNGGTFVLYHEDRFEDIVTKIDACIRDTDTRV